MEWKDIEISDNELRKQTDLYIKLALEAAAKSGNKAEFSAGINSDKSSNDSNIIGNDINISDINIIVGNNTENVSAVSTEKKQENDEIQSSAIEYEEEEHSDYIDKTEAEENPQELNIQKEEEYDLQVSEKAEEKLQITKDSESIFSDISFLEYDSSNAEDFEKYIKQHNNQTDNFQS